MGRFHSDSSKQNNMFTRGSKFCKSGRENTITVRSKIKLFQTGRKDDMMDLKS